MQECHPERELWICTLPGERSFAALRMTKRDGLVFEMYCPQGVPLHFMAYAMWGHVGATLAVARYKGHLFPQQRVIQSPLSPDPIFIDSVIGFIGKDGRSEFHRSMDDVGDDT